MTSTTPTQTPRRIILFKSPTPNPCATALPDPYSHLFKSAGFEVYFVPVLEETFVNEDVLGKLIEAGPGGKVDGQNGGSEERGKGGYDAVVATSQRAGAAWINAAQGVARRSLEIGSSKGKGKAKGRSTIASDEASSSSPNSSHMWSSVPLFTPGPSTTTAFDPATIPSKLSAKADVSDDLNAQEEGAELEADLVDLVPSPFSGADGTGSGSALAEFMVSRRIDWESADRPGRILVLTGDKNTPELPTILKGAGMELEELEVYRTSTRRAFASDLRRLFSSLELEDTDEMEFEDETVQTNAVWLALFSPSSAHAVVSALSTELGIDRFDTPTFRLAAIGKTTRDWLEGKEGWKVDAVAGKPTAGGLVEAVEQAERRERVEGRVVGP